MTEGGVITVGLALVAGLVWAVRMEGFVRAHEKEIAQLRMDMRGEIAELKEDVKYIRERIDRAMGRHG